MAGKSEVRAELIFYLRMAVAVIHLLVMGMG